MHSDHELIERCRLGDTAAFDVLVRRWEAPIGRLLWRLIGGNSAAAFGLRNDLDDLSQEVFLRVLRACDRYERRSAFSTWIYRIAVNVTRDALRRKRTWWNSAHRHAGPLPDISPSMHAARADRDRLVGEALARLPARLREPLVLRHYGDLTFAQTAEVLGIPVGTAKSRVTQGLLRLREELRRRGIDEQDLDE